MLFHRLMIVLFLFFGTVQSVFAQTSEEQTQGDLWPVANKTSFLLGIGFGFDANVLGFKAGVQHSKGNYLLRATVGIGLSSLPFLINPNASSYYPNPSIEYYFFRNQNHYLGVGIGFFRTDFNHHPTISFDYTSTTQIIPLTINYLQDIGDVHGFQFYGSLGLASYYYYELEKDVNNPLSQDSIFSSTIDFDDGRKYNKNGESKSIDTVGSIGFSYVF